MQTFSKSTILALLFAGSVCQALTVELDGSPTMEVRPKVCGQVRHLAYTKTDGRVERAVVTVNGYDEIRIHDHELSEYLAAEFIELKGRDSSELDEPNVREVFGSFFVRVLVRLCVYGVRVQEQTNQNGSLIKAGYLEEDSTAEHQIFL
jgi:hypothetical protein